MTHRCGMHFSYLLEDRQTALSKKYLFCDSACRVAFDCQRSNCIVFMPLSSLLTQLPEENVTLLCHLFGVLYRIHTHSEVNQMTATNLALCIAPNMLWRSSQISPEKEGQGVLQVTSQRSVCFNIPF